MPSMLPGWWPWFSCIRWTGGRWDLRILVGRESMPPGRCVVWVGLCRHELKGRS